MHVRTGPSRGKDARQVKLELAKLQHDLSTLLESYRVARSRVRELRAVQARYCYTSLETQCYCYGSA